VAGILLPAFCRSALGRRGWARRRDLYSHLLLLRSCAAQLPCAFLRLGKRAYTYAISGWAAWNRYFMDCSPSCVHLPRWVAVRRRRNVQGACCERLLNSRHTRANCTGRWQARSPQRLLLPYCRACRYSAQQRNVCCLPQVRAASLRRGVCGRVARDLKTPLLPAWAAGRWALPMQDALPRSFFYTRHSRPFCQRLRTAVTFAGRFCGGRRRDRDLRAGHAGTLNHSTRRTLLTCPSAMWRREWKDRATSRAAYGQNGLSLRRRRRR